MLVRLSSLHHHVASPLKLRLVDGKHARLLHNANLIITFILHWVLLLVHLVLDLIVLVSLVVRSHLMLLLSCGNNGGIHLWHLACLNWLFGLGFGLLANDIQHTILQSFLVARQEVLLPIESGRIELQIVAFHALLEE